MSSRQSARQLRRRSVAASRTKRRALSAPPHKFDSPLSAAARLAEERQRRQHEAGASSAKKKKNGKKAATSKKKKASDAHEGSNDSSRGRRRGSSAKGGSSNGHARSRPVGASSSAAGSPHKPRRSAEAAAAAEHAAAAERMVVAFDFAGLSERIESNVAHWTRVNREELEPLLAAQELEARERARAEEAELAEQRTREQEEADQAAQEAAAAAAAAAAPIAVTSRGRAVKRAEPPGKPTAELGHVPPERMQRLKKNGGVGHAPGWNTEEYRRRNQEQFRDAAAEAAQAAAASAAAAVAAARSYTSFQLDPLRPDRDANEVFQLPPIWRMKWSDAGYRLQFKLAHLPTLPEGGAGGASFSLPFEEFGEQMARLQRRDVMPKFKLISTNKLCVPRDVFNAAMGLTGGGGGGHGGEGGGGDDDDDDVCTCRYRDPATLPKKGSKEALADSAAGRSWNCGEDCINRLLKIECTAANCGLTLSKSSVGVDSAAVSAACGNRCFTRGLQHPGIEAFKTEFKGWGLRCPSGDIDPGAFLLEYVGEVIDNAECQRRMQEENERVRRANEEDMRRTEAIRRREERERIESVKKKWKEEEQMSRNNPNGYYPRIMPEELQQLSAANTKGSRGASARVQSQKGGKHKQGAAGSSSSSSRPVSRRVEYGGAASDPSALHADEYIEGRGSRLASFYFLNLGSDIIIDAGARGGLARFTNHSCAPNCHIEKWNVGGVVRIGIFANQRIERGRELTIDYQYDRVGNGHRQACFCGEPNCAKFIGAAKKELVDSSSGNGRNKQKKAAEPTRLHLDDYDEVCCICGDGGELLMCDAKVCGSFCTRGYHAACVHLLPEEVPKRWICPYHQCDSCGSRQPRYFCHTCNESACEKCWQKSRAARPGEGEPETEVENLGAANAWAIFHASRVRRDVPNYGRNVWTCCTTCQVDPMCMREPDRVQLYAQMAQGMVRAIEERRADIEPGSDRGPSFGGEGVTAQELVTRMDNNEFTPRFDYFYWAISQGKRGTWRDGYVPPSLRKQSAEAKEAEAEEESDDAWIERKYREAHPDIEDEDEEEGEDTEEEEHKESDVDGMPAVFPAAAAASAAAAPSPAAAVAAEPVPMDMDEDEDESPSASPAAAAIASTVAPSARQPREKLEPRKHLSYKTSRDRDAAARAFATATAAAAKPAARNGTHTAAAAAASKPSRGQKRRAADAIEHESEQDEAVEDNDSARRVNKRGRRASMATNGHHASIASISVAAAASSAATASAAAAASAAASSTKRRGRPPASKHQQQPPAHNNLALTPLTSSRHASSRALAAAAAAAASSSGLTVTVSKRKRGHCSIAPAAPLTDTESSESNSDESDLVDTRADAAAAAAASQSSNNGKRPRRASSVRGQLAQLTEQQQLERALAESSAAAVAAVQAKTNAALAAARAAEAAGASSSSSSSSAAKSVATRGAAAATATNGTTTQKFASGLRSVLGKFFSPPSASTRKEKGSA